MTKRPLLAPVLSLFTVALLLPLTGCGGDAPPPPSLSPAELDQVWVPDGPWIEVHVHELHCTSCEDSARRAVGALPGVEAVEADQETDIVRIRLGAGVDRYATIPAIRDALHGIGKDIVGEDPIPDSTP